MKPWGKFGLILSGAAVVLMAAPALVVYIGAPGFSLGDWIPKLFFIVCGAVFALGILISAAFSHRLYLRFFLDFFSMKTTKKGLGAGWSLALLLILLSAFGYLASRFDRPFDLTEEKINSLSGQTKEILDVLEKDLVIRVFYNGGSLSEAGQASKRKLKALLSLYKRQSRRAKAAFIDTRKNNVLAGQYLSSLPDREQKEIFVFADYDGRRVRAEEPPFKPNPFMRAAAAADFGEEEITSAIIKARKRGEKEILFLVGHGERDLKTEAPGALKLFNQYLRDSGFALREWSFIQDGAPEAPPALVMIAGPRRPFLPGETDWLKGYLAAGGRMFLALDPGEKHGLKGFLADHGVIFKDQFIITPPDVVAIVSGVAGDSSLTAASSFDKFHPITKRFGAGDHALFARASPLERDPEAPENLRASLLARGLPASLSVPSLREIPKKVQRKDLESFVTALEIHRSRGAGSDGGDKEKDGKEAGGKIAAPAEKEHGHEGHEHKESHGKSPPAAEGKDSSGGFRLAVFGDSDFLTNRLLNFGINRDLALNTVAHLLDEEELITIRPKRLKGTKISLARRQKRGLKLLFGFLPALFLSAAAVLWILRRKA